MAVTPGTLETSTSAGAEQASGVDSSQLDIGSLNAAQVEALFRGESVEVPTKSSGEGTAVKAEEAPKPAKVEAPTGTPPAAEAVAVEPEKEVEGEVETEVEAAASVEATAEAEAAAAAQAEADAAAAAENDDDPPLVNRPRLDPREQAIMGVYMEAKRSGNPITMGAAETIIDGLKPAAETVAVVPAVDLRAAVASHEAEIVELTKALEGHEDGLYSKEVRELTTKLGLAQAKLEHAQGKLEDAIENNKLAEAAATERSVKLRTDAHAKALAEFPDAASDKTPLGKAIAKRVNEIRNPNHPDHQLLHTDSCPLTLARDVAAELGIAPRRTAATPPAKTPVVPPRKVVSPPPGNKTAVVAAQPAEDAKAQLETALHGEVSLADLDAIQGVPDQSKLLAGAVR